MPADGEPADGHAVRREAERVADRLRLVAARLNARGGAQGEQTLAEVRSAVQQLADLAAEAEGQPHRRVPVLDVHALGDQVLVFVHDLAAAGSPTALASAHDVLRALRRQL